VSKLKRFEKRVLKTQKKIAAEHSLASAPRVLRGNTSSALPSESVPSSATLYVPQHLRPAAAMVSSSAEQDSNARRWNAGSRTEDYSASDPVLTAQNNYNNGYDASEVYYAPELTADYENTSQPGRNTPRSQHSTFVPQQNKNSSYNAAAAYRPRTFTPSAPTSQAAAPSPGAGTSSKLQGLLDRKFAARSPAIPNRTFSNAN
jgi:hypothetical protein